jgi:hypothetical protein
LYQVIFIFINLMVYFFTINISIQSRLRVLLRLLLGDTDSATTSTGGLGVLTSDTNAPVVTKTTVTSDSLQSLDVFTELDVNTVGGGLGVLAVLVVLLSVQEPVGDLVLTWVSDNGHNSVNLNNTA